MAIDVENAELQPISGLPAATVFAGLFTIGTDANNRSVKVPLAALANPPKIGSNGHWLIWSLSSGGYVDSGYVAKGDTGAALTFDDLTEAQKAALRGEAGVGISSTEVGYCTTIGQDVDIEQLEWSSEVPEVQVGHWFWTRVVLHYTNNASIGFVTKSRHTADGKSAYQIAVEGGYAGTYEEYAAMLANLGDMHIVLSESQYEALQTKDPTKIYMTYEDE